MAIGDRKEAMHQEVTISETNLAPAEKVLTPEKEVPASTETEANQVHKEECVQKQIKQLLTKKKTGPLFDRTSTLYERGAPLMYVFIV